MKGSVIICLCFVPILGKISAALRLPFHFLQLLSDTKLPKNISKDLIIGYLPADLCKVV